MVRRTLLCTALLLAFITGNLRAQSAVPLAAKYEMSSQPDQPGVLADTGPFAQNGKINGATLVSDPQRGRVLKFDNIKQMVEVPGDKFSKIGTYFSVTCWVNTEKLPEKNNASLIRKGENRGWQLVVTKDGKLWFHGSWGGGWIHGPFGGSMPLHQWTHIAMTYEKGQKLVIYVNGTPVVTDAVKFGVWPVGDPFRIGGTEWSGLMDDVKLYAAALTPEQVKQDMLGQLTTRPATDADIPVMGYPVRMALARFDVPIPFAGFCYRTRQTATRVAGPDAVDWPRLKLSDGRELFNSSAAEDFEVPLAEGAKSYPLFRQSDDLRIVPTGQWLRAAPWRWGQYYINTTDRTARAWSSDYELWAFPVLIKPESGTLREVTLTLDGATLYQRKEELHSLTLLLPANVNGKPYELRVNGAAPITFNVGLAPLTPEKPEDVPLVINQTIQAGSQQIRVGNVSLQPTFPNDKEWQKDLASLGQSGNLKTPPAPVELPVGQLGVDVPRSGVETFATSMSAGMSGGFKYISPHIAGYKGTPEEYATFLAGVGYDFVGETINLKTLRDNPTEYEQWLNAMGQRGLRVMLNAEGYSDSSQLGNPNIAFYAANLPEWHQPLYREYQLLTERFARYPAFVGIFTGADNAGYVPYWDWAPPHPNRPWGRAMCNFQQTPAPQVPVAKSVGKRKDYEVLAQNHIDFIEFIRKYDTTWSQYGYFASAVATVRPELVFTIGSFGSSPGVFGRGGWPAATVPSEPIFNGLSVQTAYDWNESTSYKPVHNLALVDRLKSGGPNRPTWSIIDEFGLFAGREARQRAYALVLTRGVQAVGTNFMAHTSADENYRTGGIANAPVDPRKRAEVIAEQKELYQWIHRFGGVYSQMRPLSTIGILYVHEQALSRAANGTPKTDPMYNGSHEGKATEALFICHAAGIPARIVLPSELQRGLPADMQALLLVGLNKFDNTWVWHQGLESALNSFVSRGGKILRDDESVCPVASMATGMRVAAYITQNNEDQAPLLFSRNEENIQKLRQTATGMTLPVATSQDSSIWAIPSEATSTQYLTVVNWGIEPGKQASRFVKPQTGNLNWRTDRPIYDLATRRKLTATDAAKVDLTHDGFRLYALPKAEPQKPTITVDTATSGQATVKVSVGSGLDGIPVEITLTAGGNSQTVYGATGQAIALPLMGNCTITATELLSGLSSSTTAMLSPVSRGVYAGLPVKNFLARKDRPLAIALTPAQAKDTRVTALANQLKSILASAGRESTIRQITPGDVVLSLQPQEQLQPYPQWRTIDSDLVLLGSPRDNVLIYDQWRAQMLPANMSGAMIVTGSPFVGEQMVLNILGENSQSLENAARELRP